jgi:hypothetical protein
MRVWVPISTDQLLELEKNRSLPGLQGFAVTDSWAASREDQDEEVLESDILAVAASLSPIVVVVEAPAEQTSGNSGAVQLSNAIGERQIQAIFAASPQEPDEMLWFGPTERLEILDFLSLSDD